MNHTLTNNFIIKLIFLLSIILNGCKDANKTISTTSFNKILVGQTLSYDEEVIDSLELNSTQFNLPEKEKSLLINKNCSETHVIVSVPDTNVKSFKIVRTILKMSDRDTLANEKNQIWKSELYNSTYKKFDRNNNLIRIENLPKAISEPNINEIPLSISYPNKVTDSIRLIFKNKCKEDGSTVNELGNFIKVVSILNDNSIEWKIETLFDRNYLCIDSLTTFKENELWNSVKNTYQTIGNYRVAVKIIDKSFMRMSVQEKDSLNSIYNSYINNPPIIINQSMDKILVHIINLSNILIP